MFGTELEVIGGIEIFVFNSSAVFVMSDTLFVTNALLSVQSFLGNLYCN